MHLRQPVYSDILYSMKQDIFLRLREAVRTCSMKWDGFCVYVGLSEYVLHESEYVQINIVCLQARLDGDRAFGKSDTVLLYTQSRTTLVLFCSQHHMRVRICTHTSMCVAFDQGDTVLVYTKSHPVLLFTHRCVAFETGRYSTYVCAEAYPKRHILWYTDRCVACDKG